MHSRYLIIATAALALAGTAVAAEPQKPAAQPASQPATDRPAEVVLASAAQLPAPAVVAPAQATPAPKKPRAARVTSCRCAGQNGQNEQ